MTEQTISESENEFRAFLLSKVKGHPFLEPYALGATRRELYKTLKLRRPYLVDEMWQKVQDKEPELYRYADELRWRGKMSGEVPW